MRLLSIDLENGRNYPGVFHTDYSKGTFSHLEEKNEKIFIARFGFDLGWQERIKITDKDLKAWQAANKHTPDLYMKPKKSAAMANSSYNALGLTLEESRQQKKKLNALTQI